MHITKLYILYNISVVPRLDGMAHYQVPAVVHGIIESRTWVRGMFSRSGHKHIEDEKLLDHHLSPIEVKVKF